MSNTIIQPEISEQYTKMSLRKKIAATVGALTAVGALAGGISLLVKNANEQAALDIAKEVKMQAEIREDFSADGLAIADDKLAFGYDYLDGNNTVILDLGNCTLSGVKYEMKLSEDSSVIDTNSYNFSGVAYPEFGIDRVRVGLHYKDQPYVSGSEVVFKFDNDADLKNILGPDPCITLANQITREDIDS